MSAEHDLTGVRLDDRYTLTRLMGQGGMGHVYEGIHEFLARRVAIKVLVPRLACESTYRERFLREAKAASKIGHLNVVEILDFGNTPNGSVYFVMEFLEGLDLKALLKRTGPLPWPRARALLLQILAALEAAHAQRIIHRDIKPANCFVISTADNPEMVKLLDFGIAKVAVEPGEHSGSLAQSLTNTGEVFGTVKYMAPEQATGISDDPRSDMYSVGVVAYEMLTGQVPFSGPFAFQIINRHVNEPPRPPREHMSTIPPAVEAFVLRALAKRPEHRFESMQQMRRALAAIPVDAPGATVSVPVSGPVSSSSGPTPPGGTVRVETSPARPSSQSAATLHADSSAASAPTTDRSKTVGLLVIGLLGALAFAGSLVLILRTVDREDGSASSARTLPAAAAPAGATVPSNPPPQTDESSGDATTTGEDGSTSDATGTSTGAAPTPDDAPRPRRKRTSRGGKMTDSKVRARLEQRLAGCIEGPGVKITVDLVVGSDGGILNKRVKGASGSVETCALGVVRKAKFPAGAPRRFTLQASK